MSRALCVLLALAPLSLVSCGAKDDTGTPPEGDADTDVDTDTDVVYCEGIFEIKSEGELDAIAHCESITGGLYFFEQDWLEIVELPSLTSVGGHLVIEGNGALTSLEGLSSLTTVGTYLVIYDNHALTSLEGLSSLTTVGGGGGFLFIINNDALTSLEGLSGLTYVGDDLSIHNNDSLCQSDAEAFAASIELGGTVDVRDNGTARTDCP